jgi:hypothetical protein
MKTEPTISIQDEVAKIHAQYGTTEMANYQIEKLFEKYVKQFSPKIKQLEWVEIDEDGMTRIKAETPFGDYEVYEKSDYDGYILWWFDPTPYAHVFGTEMEAKTYAQANFEKRVMECLDLKAQQKQRLINMMRWDEEIGLYNEEK